MIEDQIQQIKQKLKLAKEKDANRQVFGAGSHKYELNPPLNIEIVEAFEKIFQIQLPECYRAFVLNVGNGGSSYLKSGAGPFFGIYPLGQSLDDLIYHDVEKHLSGDCKLYPSITEAQWEELIDFMINDEDIPDEEFDKLNGSLYAGLLPLGSQGCTYIHALVLNGPHQGMVVNLDRGGDTPPTFSKDKNFLDWYERWLDEIISGKLIRTSPSWFGYSQD
ncbi:SMI1/KNR4 family protein [Flagellimonas crocea]|uniref:SMI1/KNR4 family protein n=1 Tax=Flagellimonas crocea TaxID=3067311 RepID=UPI00296E8C2A|nr:SMI1/KNR4 family protein [Muricauda sp. DH64]